MKKILISLSLIALTLGSFAQEEGDEERGKFKKENIFIGGGIGLGIGGWSQGFNIGANPEFGYSVAPWLDAGVSTNVNYFSFRGQVNNGIRQRSLNLGVGAFTRLYPLRGFFIQALPEYNWITTNLKNMNFGSAGETYKIKQEAPSLLLGVGYGTRNIGRSNFYTAIMFDVGDNSASPYIDSYGSKLPVLRTGFNIYLRPKRQR